MPWTISRSRKKRLREAVVKRDGTCCHWCGIETVPGSADGRQTGNARTLDHMHRRREGGPDQIANLVIACHECNQADVSGLELGTPVFV